MQKLVLISNNVQLPDREELCPGIIEIQCESGKIIRVKLGKADGKTFTDGDKVDVWDLGDLVVLPGLVEYVLMIDICRFFLSCNTYQCTCTFEWARSHRLGGFWHWNQGCGGWWFYYRGRYAAQLNSSNNYTFQSWGETASGTRTVLVGCCVLGWCHTAQSGRVWSHRAWLRCI